jgi:glutamate/tyrosine decarboxylase-like PLP-dependent enzyme
MALYGLLYRFFHHEDAYFTSAEFSSSIDSLTFSGHKIPTIPSACGIFLAKKELINKALSNTFVDYLGSHDLTILGSRDGHHALLFYQTIKDG